MAELATRDGMQPPSVPTGVFACTLLDDGSIRIDAADPRVLISGELLEAIARQFAIADGTEAFQLNARLDMTGCMPPPWRATYVGAVLHIEGVNRHAVYRITDYLPRIHGYVAEWPD